MLAPPTTAWPSERRICLRAVRRTTSQREWPECRRARWKTWIRTCRPSWDKCYQKSCAVRTSAGDVSARGRDGGNVPAILQPTAQTPCKQNQDINRYLNESELDGIHSIQFPGCYINSYMKKRMWLLGWLSCTLVKGEKMLDCCFSVSNLGHGKQFSGLLYLQLYEEENAAPWLTVLYSG